MGKERCIMKIDCPFYHTDGYEIEVEHNKHYDVNYLTYRRVNFCEILNEEIYCCGNKENCRICCISSMERASGFYPAG